MEGFRCIAPVTVRFRDCDPMGHVNNAVYFTYLEEARFRWIREVLGPDGFAKHGIILADAKCSFRSAAKPGEALEVGVRVTRIGRSSFQHVYRVEKVEGRVLIAEAESVGVGFDYATERPRELGDEFRRLVEAYQGPLPPAPKA